MIRWIVTQKMWSIVVDQIFFKNTKFSLKIELANLGSLNDINQVKQLKLAEDMVVMEGQ